MCKEKSDSFSVANFLLKQSHTVVVKFPIHIYMDWVVKLNSKLLATLLFRKVCCLQITLWVKLVKGELSLKLSFRIHFYIILQDFHKYSKQCQNDWITNGKSKAEKWFPHLDMIEMLGKQSSPLEVKKFVALQFDFRKGFHTLKSSILYCFDVTMRQCQCGHKFQMAESPTSAK